MLHKWIRDYFLYGGILHLKGNFKANVLKYDSLEVKMRYIIHMCNIYHYIHMCHCFVLQFVFLSRCGLIDLTVQISWLPFFIYNFSRFHDRLRGIYLIIFYIYMSWLLCSQSSIFTRNHPVKRNIFLFALDFNKSTERCLICDIFQSFY